MHLYRREYSRPIPPDAVEVKDKKGAVSIRWKGRNGLPMTGKPHPKKPGFVLVETRNWCCEYTDHTGRRQRVKLFVDRAASEREMIKLRDRVERIKSGDISPGQVARGSKSVAEMISEWGEAIRAGDAKEDHVKSSLQRVGRVAEEIRANRLTDFTADEVLKALKRFREVSRPISPQTSNHYLTSCKSFLRWCVRQRFIEADPLVGADPVECDSRRTFERRSLTGEELARLIASARGNVIHQSPLTGPDRAALYLCAAYTGFRVGELASLTRDSFRLEGDQPAIALAGASSKNRRAVIQPIPDDVAAELRGWLAGIPVDRAIWPGYRWRTGKVCDLLRLDLAAAGIHEETPAGRVDFHALRTTYATMLARAGVPIQHAQRLMRHSDPGLTMKHYTRLGINDLGEQVDKLPRIKPN